MNGSLTMKTAMWENISTLFRADVGNNYTELWGSWWGFLFWLPWYCILKFWFFELQLASAKDRVLWSTAECLRLQKLLPDAKRVIMPDRFISLTFTFTSKDMRCQINCNNWFFISELFIVKANGTMWTAYMYELSFKSLKNSCFDRKFGSTW